MTNTLDRWLTAWRGGTTRDLNTILELAAAASLRPIPEQIDWLRSLVRWVRGRRDQPFTPEARTHLLLQRLHQHPQWASDAGAVIAQLLTGGSALRIFSGAGLPSSASFSEELVGRVLRSVLPPVLPRGSLAGVLRQVFARRGDDRWLERIPSSEVEGLLVWLIASIPPERREALAREAAEAIWLLGNHTASIALREAVSSRSRWVGVLAHHPMILLEDEARAFAAAISAGRAPDLTGLLTASATSRHFLDGITERIEERGVSIDLVFQMERAGAYITRMESLSKVLALLRDPTTSAEARSSAIWALLSRLVRGELEDQRPGEVIGQSIHLIARATVERAGKTGAEGIAHTNAELRHTLLAAVGGGVLVAVMAVVKYFKPHGLPSFFEALYDTLNYGGGFTLMYFLHLKLATKMPAMTASALSSRLADRPSEEANGEFVATASAILRTQVAAVGGNLLGVVPAALLIDRSLVALGAGHLFAPPDATALIEAVRPWASATMLFAIFTGVILWIAGWVASWVDNAFAYYRVPGALQAHGGLRVRLGEARLAVVVAFLSRHVAGVAAAWVLGFGLAFAPQLGEFFGLPLEVRHVTLVAANLSLSVGALGFAALDAHHWASLVSGVAVIGVFNLGVAFALAFGMALRARRMQTHRGVWLLAQTAWVLLRHPTRLLWVPREPAQTSD